MNAISIIRDLLAGDSKARVPERRTFRHGWVSYFDSLSSQQQKAVLAYTGDDTVGVADDVSEQPLAALRQA